MSKIGILGGTFNPIHNGHTELAQYCKGELKLDRVLIIPDYTPPHKSNGNLVSSEHRLNMCRLAVKDLDGFTVSTIELERKGKSYTYETLTSLKELNSKDDLYFITGADMFLTLHTWRNPEVIFEKASIVAAPRNSSDNAELKAYYRNVINPMGAKAYILEKPLTQVSSTFIRENITDKKLVAPLINQYVYEYIEKNNLYRK